MAILSRSSDEIRDQIAALELDAGVTYLDGTAPGRVQTVPLFTENLCLVDRSAETGPASWAEAATRPLCLLTPDMQNRRIVAAELAKAGSPVAPRVESNSMLAILSHVSSGAWAAILPQALGDGLPLPDRPGKNGNANPVIAALDLPGLKLALDTGLVEAAADLLEVLFVLAGAVAAQSGATAVGVDDDELVLAQTALLEGSLQGGFALLGGHVPHDDGHRCSSTG